MIIRSSDLLDVELGFNEGSDLCLYGLPGSGKSTLASKLESYLRSNYPETDVAFVSVGDIARSLSEETRKTGAYAPEDELRAAVKEWVEHYHGLGYRVVLEGIPRSFSQLVFIVSILKAPLFIHLTTPGLICIERLVRRGRQDDTIDSIVSRMDVTSSLVGRIQDFMRGSPHCMTINGTEPFDDLTCHGIVWSSGWRD